MGAGISSRRCQLVALCRTRLGNWCLGSAASPRDGGLEAEILVSLSVSVQKKDPLLRTARVKIREMLTRLFLYRLMVLCTIPLPGIVLMGRLWVC